MVIDIIALIVLVLAMVKGWTKGLVMAGFTFFSYFLALFVAFKFSGWVANQYLQDLNQGVKWSAVVSFLLVMVVVMVIVRVAGRLVEKSIEWMLLGIWNKLAGFGLFAIVYFSLYAVVLVYASRFNVINKLVLAESVTGNLLLDWGQSVLALFGKWIPEIKDLFNKVVDQVKQ